MQGAELIGAMGEKLIANVQDYLALKKSWADRAERRKKTAKRLELLQELLNLEGGSCKIEEGCSGALQ